MFTIDCPTHGRPVLVTDRRVRQLRNTDNGIVLDIECWCGTHITLVTGRRATRPLVDAA
jgi:hypothetical protein